MEDDHSGEDHNDEDEHQIFSQFPLWILIPSTVLIFLVQITGLASNGVILYLIYKRKIGIPSINPVLVLTSIKNLVAIATCLPLAAVMLINPDVINDLVCGIQENITYIVLFSDLLYAGVLSVVRYDQVCRPHRRLLAGRRVYWLLLLVSVVSLLLGIQSTLQGDVHGCHMWSRIVDPAVIVYLITICVCILVSSVVMVACFVAIYVHSNRSINNVQAVSNAKKEDENASSSTERVSQKKGGGKNSTFVMMRRKMNAAILTPLLVNVAVIALCWMPWVILNAVTLGLQDTADLRAEVRILSIAIVYIPVSTDPVVFLAFSTKGRNAIKSLFNIRIPNDSTETRVSPRVSVINSTER